MKEVFISYSTVDSASAETVRNVLEKNGLSCWMAPRDIPGGSNYTKEIPIAIRNCKVFVLILSENAQNSHWVLKELDSAVNCGKVILPFMLEDCILNDEFNFLLTGAQRYSAYQKKAEAMETLIGRIRGILDVPAASNTSSPEGDVPKGQGVGNTPSPELTGVGKQPAKKPAPKTVLTLDEPTCPGCGSSDVKNLPNRVVRQNAKEWATLLLIPVFAALGSLLMMLIGAFIPTGGWFELLTIFSLAGLIGGGILGSHVSKTAVRRSRLRNRQDSKSYRCNRCGKRFLHTLPLDD